MNLEDLEVQTVQAEEMTAQETGTGGTGNPSPTDSAEHAGVIDGGPQQTEDYRSHFAGLERQAAAMRQAVPDFDLGRELENPLFVRLTSPFLGVSVEDAFYAVHRRELQAASAQVTAEKIANAIQSGSRRPAENGLSGKAASVAVFDYRKATPEQKLALKRRIREAAARGEKVYPGR